MKVSMSGLSRGIRDGVIDWEGRAVADAVVEEVSPGVFSYREMSLGLESHGATYNIIMKLGQQPGVLTGRWVKNPTKQKTGTCVGRVYVSEDGPIILHGSWTEDNVRYEWITELKSET